MNTGVPGRGQDVTALTRRLVAALALVVLAAVPALAGGVRLRPASDRKPVEFYLAPDPEPPQP